MVAMLLTHIMANKSRDGLRYSDEYHPCWIVRVRVMPVNMLDGEDE